VGGHETQAATDFLTLLSSEDRAALRSRGGMRRFKPGATLMLEGQRGDEVMVLLAGRVKVTFATSDGKEVVLQFCGPGDLIGELAVVDDRPRSSTVEAVEPVEVLAFSAADFRGFLESRPEAATALLQTISRRFRDADRRLIEFAASQTLARVAARLIELAERYGEPVEGGVAIDLRLSQEELAGWTGSSREAVAKALHSLRDLGLVVTERRRITLCDLEALRRQAV
jgi:CRP/FNR family cyclic AMP-dependent transcriptional regulator